MAKKGEEIHQMGVEVVSASDEQSERSRELDKEYLEAFKPAPPGCPRWLIFVNLLIICGLLGVMALFTHKIVNQYLEEKATPSTNIKVTSAKNLDFPSITVCPLSPYVPFTLDRCDWLERKDYCTNEVVFRDDIDAWNCYEINPFNGSQLATNRTGFSSSIDLWFTMDFTAFEDGDLAGVYVYFQDNKYSRQYSNFSDVRETSFFASHGMGTVFSLKKTTNKEINQAIPTVFYEASISILEFARNISETPDYDSVFLTISYNDLAVTEITQKPSYELQNLFGDFAGMLGTLVGIDAWKAILLIQMMPRVFKAFKRWIGRRREHQDWTFR